MRSIPNNFWKFTKNLRKRLKKIRPEVWLILILIFALFLRLHFFVSVGNADSADAGIYVNSAIKIVEGEFHYPSLSQEEYTNPIIIPAVLRTFMLYPTAFFIFIFGLNKYSLALFPLLCSLGSIIVIYKLGSLLFNKKIGLIASFLLSIFPLSVIYSTRSMPDIPMTFFMVLSVFLFLRAELGKNNKNNYILYILSGIFWGMSYLIKEFSIVLILFFVIYFIYKKRIKKHYLLLLLGFLTIFFLELLFFYLKTGYPFYRIAMTGKAHLFKIFIEGKGYYQVKSFFNLITFYYPINYPFLYHSKTLFSFLTPHAGIYYFGFFYYFAVLGLIYGLYKKNKNIIYLLIWLIPLFLFLEFGATNIEFEKSSLISYMFIFKEIAAYRFSSIITVPILLAASYFLYKIFNYKVLNVKLLGIVLFLFLFVSSIYFIEKDYEYYYEGQRDIIEAAEFLKDGDNKIYTDSLAIDQLTFLLGLDQKEKFKNICNIDASQIENNSFVLIGGSRGRHFGGGWITNNYYPDYVFNPPSNWKIIKIIGGKKTGYREENMTIYEVK